jgi:hypothetical protein
MYNTPFVPRKLEIPAIKYRISSTGINSMEVYPKKTPTPFGSLKYITEGESCP